MKNSPLSLASWVAALAAAVSWVPSEAGAQGRLVPPRNDGPPELDFSSVSPDAGFQLSRTITVSGAVTDDVGIREVLYRVHGSNQWRPAGLAATQSDTDTRQTTAADFFFRLGLKAGGNTRVDIRVIDIRDQESEFLTRRFRFVRSENDIPEGEEDAEIPQLVEGSITPAAGLNLDRTITISGSATDDSGVERVEYRIGGTKRWRPAILTEGDTARDFFFQVRLSSAHSTRVVIKAIDDEGRESDYLTRRFRYDKYRRSLLRAPSTGPVPPTEPPVVTPLGVEFESQALPDPVPARGFDVLPARRLRPVPVERPFGDATRAIFR